MPFGVVALDLTGGGSTVEGLDIDDFGTAKGDQVVGVKLDVEYGNLDRGELHRHPRSVGRV